MKAASSTTPVIPVQVAAAPRAGPRRAIQTKPIAATPSISDTSEVFDVDISTSTRASPAKVHHSRGALGD